MVFVHVDALDSGTAKVFESSPIDFAAMVSNCDLFVTCDSGRMHLACALNTRTVAIFSKSEFRPLGFSFKPRTDRCMNKKSRLALARLRWIEQHATQYEWTIAPFRKVICGKPPGNVPGVNSGHVGNTPGLFDSYSVNLGLRHSRRFARGLALN